MLVWYWNTAFTNNNVGDHPGQGQILPIDAHPTPLHWSDGTLMRPRLQSYDATFGKDATDALTLHRNSVTNSFPSQPGVSVFDDMSSYWSLTDQHGQHGNDAAGDHYRVGWNSAANPHTGTSIRVKSLTPGGFMQVEVAPSK